MLDQGDADMLANAADDFRKDAPSAAIFLNHGQPWKPGQRLVQTDLARSLSLIAKSGPAAFYDGSIGTKIVAASKAGGGIFSSRDFSTYRASELKPLECDYRGYHIISAPPPSSGGVVLCETLNILEGYPIGELGFHSATGTHLLTEAMRRAYHDRNLNLGDPSFVTVDTAHFIDKGYAAAFARGSTRIARRRRPAYRRPGWETKGITRRTSRSSTRTVMRCRSPTRSTTGLARV